MSSALTPIHGACQPNCGHTCQLQFGRLPGLLLEDQKDPPFLAGLTAWPSLFVPDFRAGGDGPLGGALGLIDGRERGDGDRAGH